MFKLSEIDLGSAILSISILIGFIATAFAFIRLTIIGINYLKVIFPKEKVEERNQKNKNETKGF